MRTRGKHPSVAYTSLLVFMVVTIFSCDGGAGTSGSAGTSGAAGSISVTRRDSAGVEIVEVPGQLLDSLPSLRFASEPSMSIGAVEGEAPYNFQDISAARRLTSGEVMITDQSLELRIFGADGVFRRSYGREGAGPGEFGAYPTYVSETDGKRVAIYDPSRTYVTRMDLETGVFTTLPLSTECREPGKTEQYTCSIVRLLPDGTVFAALRVPVAPAATGAPSPAWAEGDPRLTVSPLPGSRYGLLKDATFHSLDTLQAPGIVRSGVGSDFFSAQALFQPGGQIAFGAHGFITGDPHKFEIRVRDADGALRRIIRVLTNAVPVTEALLDSHRRWADSSRRSLIAHEYLATLRAEGNVPFFGALRLDRAGRIWIRSYQAPGFWGPTSPAVWTILDGDGTPVARLAANRRGDILEAGEEYVLLRETDSDGVEFVRMYRLEAVPS
jgi:hypothetical protein